MKTNKKCKISGFEWFQYNSLQKCPCDICKEKRKKDKPPDLKLKSLYMIPKVSKKQAILNAKYTVLRIEFLGKPENEFCYIEGCGKKANTVDHRAGRKGYYDEWAKINNIPLIIDVRFFSPCCLDHNLELESNSELSKKYQLSKIHGKKKL